MSSEVLNSILAISTCFAIFVFTFGFQSAFSIALFDKDESPFQLPYDQWVTRYWNWWIATTKEQANPSDGSCLMKEDGPVVMLMDPSVGGNRKQMCDISSEKGILIGLWSGECDRGFNGQRNSSYEKLLQCARDSNKGTIVGSLFVDGVPIAQLNVVNDQTTGISNITDIRTKEFNITIPTNSHYQSDNYGTFGAAVEGWYVFLKPLPPGEHTIFLKNFVQGEGPSGFANAAELTYLLRVR